MSRTELEKTWGRGRRVKKPLLAYGRLTALAGTEVVTQLTHLDAVVISRAYQDRLARYPFQRCDSTVMGTSYNMK